MRHLQSQLIALSAFIILLATPALLHAEQHVSSSLLLPYFEVDLDGGLTTAFSVTNAADAPADFQITVHSNWGIPVLTVPAHLDGREVLTINLNHWLVGGNLPDGPLSAGELEHLQAALCGLRSPLTDSFYSTLVAPRLAVGYLKIETYGAPRPDSLFGNYFVIDPLNDFAQGDSLIDLSGGCQGACRRHAIRYMAGGLFDGGTEVLVWTGVESQPSATGTMRPQDLTPASTLFFNEQGETHDSRAFDFMAVQVVDVADLGLAHPFGWLEVTTENDTFISLRMSAMGRFSVGLRTFCMRNPIGPSIRIEKSTNGHDADSAPGPTLSLGDAVLWEYRVTNTGDQDLTDVVVDDDMGVVVSCPQTTLAVGESMTCTGNGNAISGQYKNCGFVTGVGSQGDWVNDVDCSHYWGGCPQSGNPAIDIEKATNGHDADVAPGPSILVGDPVLWTYVITNTGDVALDNVSVSDDQGVVVSCPDTSLAPGQSMTCTGNGSATLGQYQNVGSVTATSAGSASCPGSAVSGDDPSHYWGYDLPAGDEGCTPGYWKVPQHHDSWLPTGYSTDQLVPSVWIEATAYPEPAIATLLEALDFNGGPTVQDAAETLIRAAVAGLLDAAHPGVNYPRTEASIISDVNAALASGDRATMLALKDAIDADNNLGCPLN